MPTDRVRRRWFQFSLRTLLLLTTASAVASAWWLRPVPRKIPLPDGVLIRLEQIRSTADDSDWPTYVQWELHTTEGQRIARGVERDEILHGRLFLYHADGRPAIEGFCDQREPVGIWRSWSPDGKLLSEWKRESADPTAAPISTLRAWWPDGTLRMQGRVRRGREHGEWTNYDRDGRPIETGAYVDGRRHGWWTSTNPSTGDKQRVYFARGLPIPDVQNHLDRLTAGIRSDNPAVRISAILALGRLGPIGAGPLSDVLGTVPDDADEGTAVLVLRTLGGMEHDAVSALPAIRRRQTDDSAKIRLQARLAAFSIDADGRDRDRERLLAAVERLSPAAALDAMSQIFAIDAPSHPALVRQLISLIDREEGKICLLIELGARPAKVMPLLGGALDDPDTAVRSRVLDLVVAYISEVDRLDWNTVNYRSTLASLLDKAVEDPDPQLRELAGQLLAPPTQPGGAGGIF
ncbi:MAG: hypothetical protein KJ000_35585 [Pirellulaceae bacterium]|nr:hypothetical protein [Pirellulaceae bacterium]